MWSLLVVLRVVSGPVPETLLAECWGELLKPTVAKFSRPVACWLTIRFLFQRRTCLLKMVLKPPKKWFSYQEQDLVNKSNVEDTFSSFWRPAILNKLLLAKSVIFTSPSYGHAVHQKQHLCSSYRDAPTTLLCTSPLHIIIGCLSNWGVLSAAPSYYERGFLYMWCHT